MEDECLPRTEQKLLAQYFGHKRNIFTIHSFTSTTPQMRQSSFLVTSNQRGLPEVDQNKSAGVVGRNQLTESTQEEDDHSHTHLNTTTRILKCIKSADVSSLQR